MPYRRTGRSGLKLPALSLGLWHNFGHERPAETQRAILRRAFDRGVTHFDLANNYGPPAGSAEINFGRIFAQDFRQHRDEILVSTKAGYLMGPGPYGEWGSRKYMLSSLDASLGRLGLEYVDIFYSHRPDPDTPIEETMAALATAVHNGKALYAGISNYSPEQTRAAAAALADHGVPLLIHQPSYSMFNRHVENGLLPVLDEVGAGSIVFSPLAQGLLTDRYLDGTVPAGSRAATSRFLSGSQITETYLQRARALNEIAGRRGQSLAQLAITWVLRHSQVTSALIGASSVAQLDQNIAALDAAPLSAEELSAIDQFAVDGTGRS
jgi:L-glyceraldehyde 3-phosphate reductase